jgi:hypothetical protein
MPKCPPSRWHTKVIGLAVIVVAVLALCVSSVRMCQAAPPKVISAGPDAELIAAFDAYGDSGRGWTGGDSTWSTRLPDGRELFAFSDTFLTPITPPSRPSDAAFVHNSFVIRDTHGNFSTVVGGTAVRPDSLIRPSNPDHWFWLGDASYLNGLLQVPLIELRSTGAGSLDFAFVASALAIFDPSDLKQPMSITALPSARGIQWGQWIAPEDDWTYVYGIEDRDRQRHLHIARVSGHDLRQPFSFWTGTDWSPDADASARMIDGIGPELSVHRLESGQYLLTTMEDGLGTRLVGRLGPSATGPFGAATTMYVTPETGLTGTYRDADVYTYNAHVHPELSTANHLVLSYNVNSTDNALGGDIFRDVSIYRPRFVGVTLADEDAQRCFAA